MGQSRYDKAAAELAAAVDYKDVANGVDFDEAAVRRATIHTRQDLILLVSYLSSLNKQIRIVRWLLVGVIVMLIIIADGLSRIHLN